MSDQVPHRGTAPRPAQALPPSLITHAARVFTLWCLGRIGTHTEEAAITLELAIRTAGGRGLV
jgi:hypothetical protein